MTSCTRCRTELRPGANYCHNCGKVSPFASLKTILQSDGLRGGWESSALNWWNQRQQDMSQQSDASRAILSSREYLARQQDMNAAMLPTMPLGGLLSHPAYQGRVQPPQTQPEPEESFWRAFWRWLGFGRA